MCLGGCAVPVDEHSLYDIPVEFEDPFMPECTEVTFSELTGMRYEGFDEFKESITRMEEACNEEGTFNEKKIFFLLWRKSFLAYLVKWKKSFII